MLCYFTADKQFQDNVKFQKFCWQLFHSSLTHILLPFQPFIEKPWVTRCGDEHFRRVIYGLGPYIAGYPKQALLACIVSGWCPKYVWCVFSQISFMLIYYRCTAVATNLNGNAAAIPHSHEHTKAAQELYGENLQALWDGYGIIGDLIVCFSLFNIAPNLWCLINSHLPHIFLKQTFMSFWPLIFFIR